MYSSEACCTCATLLSSIQPIYDNKTEKPLTHDRHLECCGRVICGPCITKNARFATYCPFCQISNTPTSLPQGLRDPPAYSPPPCPSPSSAADPISTPSTSSASASPPPYSSLSHNSQTLEATHDDKPAPDVLHFLHPTHDTIPSLSLRYGVPSHALRKTNNLWSDNLISGHKTLLIPGSHYQGGVSLSPQPIDGEEEEERKNKVRRWMVGCKCVEYDTATLYLSQSGYDLGAAIEAYRDDEAWEREHPMPKGKQKKKTWMGVGGGMTGQLS